VNCNHKAPKQPPTAHQPPRPTPANCTRSCTHLRRQLLPVRPGMLLAIRLQFLGPCFVTHRMRSASWEKPRRGLGGRGERRRRGRCAPAKMQISPLHAASGCNLPSNCCLDSNACCHREPQTLPSACSADLNRFNLQGRWLFCLPRQAATAPWLCRHNRLLHASLYCARVYSTENAEVWRKTFPAPAPF